MDFRLYRLPIPTRSQTDVGSGVSRNVALQAALSGGSSAAESVSTDPVKIPLEGAYRGPVSDVMAEELEELADASAFGEVPFFAVDADRSSFDGFVVVESADTSPIKPQATGYLHNFSATLRYAGTSRNRYRAVAMNVQDVDNDFGSDTTAEVAVPSTASLVRWFDPVAESDSPATATATRQTQFGDVDVVDATTAPTTTSELIYQLPFDETGKTDVRVWDPRDVSKIATDYSGDVVGDATIGDATVGEETRYVRWQQVFATGHEFVDEVIVENGILRLRMDDTTGVISPWEWDPTDEAWQPLGLPSSSWTLVDVDLTHVAPVAVEAQLLFEDGGSYQALDMRLSRGSTDVLFATPVNETAPPQSLTDMLSPIASTSDKTAMESLGLRKRGDVRR